MPLIGLEIHGYIDTKEKLFCNCESTHGAKEAKPNTNICPICTGQPGSKPMAPNKSAIDKILQIALILNCRINENIQFQRKHYSWPDLPKGYQETISGPHAKPVGAKGKFMEINITECHLEEDPAAWNPQTGEIDYNRSGSPLVEIVTEPEFKTEIEVTEWLKNLKSTLSYIKAIDKKSGIKADVNISLPEKKGERVEIKNVNSIENIKTAIKNEIERQNKKVPLQQETRAFNEKTGKTTLMRIKEQFEDYRFISDPDLPLIKIDKKRIEKIKESLPETPGEKAKKLIKKHKIQKEHAEALTKNLDLVEMFEETVKKIPTKTAVPWVMKELKSILNYNKITLEEAKIEAKHFIELLEMIEKNILTEIKAREILRKFIPESFSPKEEAKKHEKVSDKKEIEKIVEKVMEKNPKAVEDYKSGKKQSINFLIGQVMKLSHKRADFRTAKEILEKNISK